MLSINQVYKSANTQCFSTALRISRATKLTNTPRIASVRRYSGFNEHHAAIICEPDESVVGTDNLYKKTLQKMDGPERLRLQ